MPSGSPWRCAWGPAPPRRPMPGGRSGDHRRGQEKISGQSWQRIEILTAVLACGRPHAGRRGGGRELPRRPGQPARGGAIKAEL